MPRVTDREARRAELVSAAAAVFAERGVANATVSDIVKAAGVAQGTFYLYFDTKDDAVLAVVARMADTIVHSTATRVAAATSAVDKLLALPGALSEVGAEPEATALVEQMHRPENRLLHDRLADDMTRRLVPLLEAIIAQGVADGVFVVGDPRAAAWFVLAGLQSVELAGTPISETPAALTTATGFALRALGCQGARR
ncbi:MAG: TetR/AcrR family transcriptional regulator [Actinobacteria bacterium]|nr:TetR/AcrR family transcriptional regulator [Actinomycetota bacterium]